MENGRSSGACRWEALRGAVTFKFLNTLPKPHHWVDQKYIPHTTLFFDCLGNGMAGCIYIDYALYRISLCFKPGPETGCSLFCPIWDRGPMMPVK